MQSFKKVKKVVFPVGGLGTRFLPATKSLPKEMLPVYNKPIIQYAFEEAVDAGIEEFIFVTGRNKNAINNHFDHAYELQHVLDNKNKKIELELTKGWIPEAGQMAFIRQQKPLGLGHAVWCARNFIGNEPFAVILADELLKKQQKGFLSEMIQLYNQLGENSNILGLYEVAKKDTNKYGIVDMVEQGQNISIKSMVEKPKTEDAPSNSAIIGRYILQPEIFDILNHQESGAGNEIQLTDAMQNLLNKQKFYGKKFTGQRFDCGNPLGLLEANISYAKDLDAQSFSRILTKY
jgi:UTP--glucose-1-phosphate uridylyltransferase